MAVVDPFERAAKREEKEELKREITRVTLLKRMQRRSDNSVATLGIPYVIWALIRAAYFHFGTPTLPRSIVHFFFGDFWLFTAYTILVLIVFWAKAISGEGVRFSLVKRVSRDDADR